MKIAIASDPEFVDPQPSGFTKKQVDEIAEKLADQVGYKPGDRLDTIVHRLGGRLEYLDLDNWMKSETGSLLVMGEKDFVIYLAQVTGILRDRFTIAHELGHYFLHSGMGEKKISVERHGSNRVEWEANWFAAGFLMPRRIFIEEYRRAPEPARLASLFLVSQMAIKVRIESLGL